MASAAVHNLAGWSRVDALGAVEGQVGGKGIDPSSGGPYISLAESRVVIQHRRKAMSRLQSGNARGGFRRGQLVQVRDEQEILATLDSEGKLDGMPFMPEMARYCGQRFKVFRRADKTCVEGFGIRRLQGAVLLEGVRCDGAFHDGCQRGCLFFWKEAWLKPATAVSRNGAGQGNDSNANTAAALPTNNGDRFYCQSTELGDATTRLPWWDARQYARDLLTRDVSLRQFVLQMWLLGFGKFQKVLGMKELQTSGGQSARMPAEVLDLQPGDIVQVRSKAEIEATLDAEGKNRGLEFTPDMLKYCGQQYRVARRVERIILETTGEMRRIRNTVILEGCACKGLHARGCPRANFHYWREAWLAKVSESERLPAGEVGCSDAACTLSQCAANQA